MHLSDNKLPKYLTSTVDRRGPGTPSRTHRRTSWRVLASCCRLGCSASGRGTRSGGVGLGGRRPRRRQAFSPAQAQAVWRAASRRRSGSTASGTTSCSVPVRVLVLLCFRSGDYYILQVHTHHLFKFSATTECATARGRAPPADGIKFQILPIRPQNNLGSSWPCTTWRTREMFRRRSEVGSALCRQQNTIINILDTVYTPGLRKSRCEGEAHRSAHFCARKTMDSF